MSSSQQRVPLRGIKSATTGKAAASSKSTLKARPSLSSIVDRTPESRDGGDETSNTPTSRQRQATAGSKRSTSPTKASVGRKSVLGPITNVEKKASPADRPSAASFGKPVSKATTQNPRTTNSPRSTRPVHYTQTVARSANAHKRLSSIASTSTQPQEDPTPASVEQQPTAMTKILRPGLESQDDMTARHAKELEATHQALMNDLLQQHKVETDGLTKELNKARFWRQEDSNRAQRLAHELVDLKNVFDNEKDKYLQSLQEASNHRMELDQEVAELQSLIQALGEQMQQGHAAGQDALEGLRLRLTKEHDELISSVRSKHEEVLQAEREDRRKKLEDMQTSHDQIILALDAIRLDHEQTIQDYAKRLEETQEALEASKPVLVEAKQIIAAKNDKLDMVNQQGIEDQANMAAAKQALTTKEAELNSVCQDRDAAKASCSKLMAQLHDMKVSNEEQADMAKAQRIHGLETATELRDHISDLQERLHSAEDSAVADAVRAREAEIKLEVTDVLQGLQQEKMTTLDQRHADMVERLRKAEDAAVSHAVRAEEAEMKLESADLLQDTVTTLKQQNADLVERLRKAEDSAVSHAARAREAEVKLESADLLQDKITTLNQQNADLVERLHKAEETAVSRAVRVPEAEMKPESANLWDFEEARATEKTSTIWPAAEVSTNFGLWEAGAAANGEGMGPSIMGNMAGMLEQLRTIASINEDLNEDHKRVVERMSSLYVTESMTCSGLSTPYDSDEEDLLPQEF